VNHAIVGRWSRRGTEAVIIAKRQAKAKSCRFGFVQQAMLSRHFMKNRCRERGQAFMVRPECTLQVMTFGFCSSASECLGANQQGKVIAIALQQLSQGGVVPRSGQRQLLNRVWSGTAAPRHGSLMSKLTRLCEPRGRPNDDARHDLLDRANARLCLSRPAASAVLYAQTRNDLVRLYTLSLLTGMRFHMAALPAGFPVAGGSLDFDPAGLTNQRFHGLSSCSGDDSPQNEGAAPVADARRGRAVDVNEAAESLSRSRRQHLHPLSASVRRLGYITVKATASREAYFSSKVMATQNGAAIASPTLT
jgi:hypothetical protein